MKYFAKSLRKNLILCFFAGWILFILVGFVVNANTYKLLRSDLIIETSTIYENNSPLTLENDWHRLNDEKERALKDMLKGTKAVKAEHSGMLIGAGSLIKIDSALCSHTLTYTGETAFEVITRMKIPVLRRKFDDIGVCTMEIEGAGYKEFDKILN